ncbi:uncharacterized protein I206_101736 [Kwoniella pini CBS 10737]|uniref:Uncharacterized protein n=1 Tax=Kwoniella pini CBS 10737 TaxID=1296096 RepID=A0A1B9HVV9_9TREE|nr:uncharacterized protein I206_06296 [Kwoniella pini CBS 10737]OCF47399.1 hypothetical protein I206_06296 [Kwoniella pini CBS 10737]
MSVHSNEDECDEVDWLLDSKRTGRGRSSTTVHRSNHVKTETDRNVPSKPAPSISRAPISIDFAFPPNRTVVRRNHVNSPVEYPRTIQPSLLRVNSPLMPVFKPSAIFFASEPLDSRRRTTEVSQAAASSIGHSIAPMNSQSPLDQPLWATIKPPQPNDTAPSTLSADSSHQSEPVERIPSSDPLSSVRRDHVSENNPSPPRSSIAFLPEYNGGLKFSSWYARQQDLPESSCKKPRFNEEE